VVKPRAKARPAQPRRNQQPTTRPAPTPRAARPDLQLGDHAFLRADGTVEIYVDLSEVVIAEVAAETAHDAGDHALAIEEYSQLIASASSPLASHLVGRGRAHYALAQYAQAIGDFERGLAVEPHFPELYFDKGKAELQAGLVAAAESSFTRDLAAGEPSPIAFYNRHLARKALGNNPGALADLDAALEGMPDSVPLRIARSILRATTGDLEGAFVDASMAAHFEPEDAGLHERCARLAFRLGALDRAAQSFATAQSLVLASGQPPNADWYAGEALSLGELGRHDDAIERFDRALAAKPGDPTLYCNRGWLHHLAGRDDQALRDLDRALELNSTYAKALHNRATLYEQRGDRARALADLHRLDELGHDVADAIARLSVP